MISAKTKRAYFKPMHLRTTGRLRLYNLFAACMCGPSTRHWVNGVGTIGVILASSTFLLERDIMRLGEMLMLVAFLAALPTAWRFLRTNPAFWLFAAWVGAMILSNSLAIAHTDIPTDHNIWNAARHWSRLGWIPLMAWLIAGRLGVVRAVLLGYTAAWFVFTLPEVSPDLLRAGLQGSRLDFGTGNPHRAALPFMITTVILAFLARDCVGSLQQGVTLFTARLGLWALALGFSTFGLFSAQGVGPLGGAVAACLIGLVVLWQHLTHGQGWSRKLRAFSIGAGSLTILIVSLVIVFKPAMESRVSSWSGGLTELSEGAIQTPTGSVGARYYLWTFAAEHWADRPVLGYGTETARSMISASDLPTRSFSHLHNSWLELLFSTGIAGTTIMVALFAHISYKIFQSTRTRRVPKRYGTLYFALLAAFILANIGESYIVFNHFWPHMALITAGFYSIALFGEPRRDQNAHHSSHSAHDAAAESC